MNIYLLNDHSVMLFLKDNELGASPMQKLETLIDGLLPPDRTVHNAELTSYALDGGMVFCLLYPERHLKVLSLPRIGQFYDALCDLNGLVDAQDCEVYRVNSLYYLLMREDRLTQALADLLCGADAKVTPEFLREHGERVASFVLDREAMRLG
jgi:hypothetical protein